MRTASVAGVLLALAFLSVPGAMAQVDVGVEVLGDSILASFTALGEPVDSIVVWFAPDGTTIGEYVVESGWQVADSAESVRAYGGTLQDGHTLKIGMKLQGNLPAIYWAAYTDGEEVQGGLLLAPEPEEADAPPENAAQTEGEAIPDSAEFRTIPVKPTPGSTVRLVGSGFGAHQDLNLVIGGINSGIVNTDAAGGFVATRTVPDTLEGRVDFVLADNRDNDMQISLRLADAVDDISTTDTDLSIYDLESAYHRGDRITVSGTATPLDTIVLAMYGPGGNSMSFRTVPVGHDGAWVTSESIILPLDTPVGEYKIVADNGYRTVESVWTVESDKVIMLEPIRMVFEPGEAFKFNGTAAPGEIIYVILQDPAGTELALDSWTVGPDGLAQWEFPTTTNAREGTYTLIVTQGAEREFVYAGLGNRVEIPTVISFDKANYLPSETPLVVIAGIPGDEINILVVDDTDSVVHRGNTTLQVDGRAVYDLDISKFSSGVYTAIAQRGTAQDDREFGVGLSTGSSTLDMMVKRDHRPGDPILVLGTTSSNVILNIALLDPYGNIVQIVETLVDKTGMLSEQRLRIPLDAETGMWSIRASSGANSAVDETLVSEQAVNELTVHVDDSGRLPDIVITGATGTYVTVNISDGDRDVVDAQRAYITDTGIGHLPWSIEIAGTYTITVESGSETVSITYRYTR